MQTTRRALAMAMAAAASVAMTGATLLACGGEPAAPRPIELHAPVSDHMPSGGVASVELSWARAPGVDRYVVTVSAPDGTRVWRTEAAGPPVTFDPEGVMGPRLRWQVEGFAGKALRARSQPGELVLGRLPDSPPPGSPPPGSLPPGSPPPGSPPPGSPPP